MNKFIFAILLTLSSLAHAGAISGGGGKGVVCRDSSGNITSAQTLDLYEGKVLYNLNIPLYDQISMQVQVDKALNVIPPSSRNLVSVYVQTVMKNMNIVHNVELQPIDDALVVAVPQGCKAEQLANYFNDRQILINGDIWDKLSPTDQAALILHEAVYAVDRITGSTNSQRSRHVVASLFDPSTAWTDVLAGAPKEALNCIAKGVLFKAYPTSPDSWTLQFQILGNHQVMSQNKATIFSQGGTFNFEEAKTFPIIPGDNLVGTYTMTSGTASSAFEDSDILTFTKRWESIKDYNTGKVIPGHQTPRYYFSWLSRNYPGVQSDEQLLNCSLVMP